MVKILLNFLFDKLWVFCEGWWSFRMFNILINLILSFGKVLWRMLIVVKVFKLGFVFVVVKIIFGFWLSDIFEV